MAIYWKVSQLGARDATVIREGVDEVSNITHDAVSDLVFQHERVVADRPVALRYHRRLRAIRHEYCDEVHTRILSKSRDRGQFGVEILQLHLPFNIRFDLQKVGVIPVSEVRLDVLILTFARDQEVLEHDGGSGFFPARLQPLTECSLRNGSCKVAPETPRLR